MILSEAMPSDNNLLRSAAAGKEVMAINMAAREEGMDPNLLLRKVASGRVVIMIAR